MDVVDQGWRAWCRERVITYWKREPTGEELNLFHYICVHAEGPDHVLSSIVDHPNSNEYWADRGRPRT